MFTSEQLKFICEKLYTAFQYKIIDDNEIEMYESITEILEQEMNREQEVDESLSVSEIMDILKQGK